MSKELELHVQPVKTFVGPQLQDGSFSIDPAAFPLIRQFVKQTGVPLAFFDLETTTNRPQSATFGIAEFAYLAFMPNDTVRAYRTLVNPENPFDSVASSINGLSEQKVASFASFAAHAERFSGLMERCVVSGFNINSFDLPAVVGQLQRYGVAVPEGRKSIDLRDMWISINNGKNSGTQTEVCKHFGITFDGAHGAVPDTVACAYLMERMLWEYGAKFALGHHKIDLGLGAGAKAQGPAAAVSTPRPPAASQTAQAQMAQNPKAQRLLQLIDGALAQNLAYPAFVGHLERSGIKINVSSYGASFIVDGEKIQGSQLGTEYGWKKLAAKIPESEMALKEAPASHFRSAAIDAGAPKGQTPAMKAKAILVELAQKGGYIDYHALSKSEGITASAISFAVSDLLQEGRLSPDQIIIAPVQTWLIERLDELKRNAPDGKLRPMMDAALSMGAPEQLDYVQLRCVLAMQAANMKPASAASVASSASKGSYHQPQASNSAAAAVASANSDVDMSDLGLGGGDIPFDGPYESTQSPKV